MRILNVDLHKDYSGIILEAVRVLKAGGAVVYPTDTVYGLGANGCDPKAVDQIFRIKNRPFEKPLPIIARNLKWVREIAHLSLKLEKILEKIWPGPITAILSKRNIIPDILTAGKQTVGVRIPDFAFAEKLLGKFGYPLTATSANISGRETITDAGMIAEIFKSKLWKPDLIINAGVLTESLPSTVLDLSVVKPKILRVGPTKPAVLIKILGIEK